MPEITNVIIKLSQRAGALEIQDLPDGALQAQAEEMPEGWQLEPVSVLTVTVSVAWLVERVVDHYLHRRETGVVIDLYGPIPRIENFRGNQGTMIIKKPNGQVCVIPAKERPRASLVETLLKLFRKNSGPSDD